SSRQLSTFALVLWPQPLHVISRLRGPRLRILPSVIGAVGACAIPEEYRRRRRVPSRLLLDLVQPHRDQLPGVGVELDGRRLDRFVGAGGNDWPTHLARAAADCPALTAALICRQVVTRANASGLSLSGGILGSVPDASSPRIVTV